MNVTPLGTRTKLYQTECAYCREDSAIALVLFLSTCVTLDGGSSYSLIRRILWLL